MAKNKMTKNSINMRRVKNKVREIFAGEIDMSDFPDDHSNHFETRALAAIALMMMAGLEASQASKHITDGYNDMGIDALYLDEIQKKLFVVQSKWKSNGVGSVSQDEMNNFAQSIYRILEEDLCGANEKINAKSADVDKALTQMGYQIHSVFIHTGNEMANKYILRPIDKLMNQTNDDVSTILVFDELNFESVFKFLSEDQEKGNINIDDVILNNWGQVSEPYTVYYGTISAATVGKWYIDFGNRLFAKNIRFYKGNTEVNEGMKKVLFQEPEKFYYYNNGIKLLCQTIQRKAKDSTTNENGLFALSGVSLVNGAQTTGTIGTCFREKPEQVGKAKIMIQIVDLSNIDTKIATQITRLSNTQNRIENKDFASIDPEQERIRKELWLSNYFYLYKSGDNITNPDNQISFDEAIVALACLSSELSYTVTAKSNVGALSEDITKKPYKVLFNSSTNSFALLNAVLFMREIERYLQEKKIQAKNRKERLVCIHANRFIVHLVLQKFVNNEWFNTEVVDKNNIKTYFMPFVDNFILQITQSINDLFPESYPANIFKNTTKCREVEERIKCLA